MTLLHSGRPKLHTVLAFLSAIGLKLLVHIKSSGLIFSADKVREVFELQRLLSFFGNKWQSFFFFFFLRNA